MEYSISKEEILSILCDKDTPKVYKRIQEIEESIDSSDDIYKYFEEIKQMLLHKKTFIRVRSFRIICNLSKWDKNNKINECIELLLNEFDNNSPISIRQCLKSLRILLLYKPELSSIIINKIKNIDLLKYKDSMIPLIKKDIEYILDSFE